MSVLQHIYPCIYTDPKEPFPSSSEKDLVAVSSSCSLNSRTTITCMYANDYACAHSQCSHSVLSSETWSDCVLMAGSKVEPLSAMYFVVLRVYL